MPEQLRPHQVEDLAFYMANEKCANLSDPGTGKTPSVCVYIEYLYKHRNCKTMWAMPKSLLGKNKEELLRFTNLTEEQVVILDGTPKQREKLLKDTSKVVVFLMGFRRFVDDWENIRSIDKSFDAMMFDEWHMGGFKSVKSKSTEAVFRAGRRMKYFLAMSGTLIDGRLDSCYSAIHIIEPRYYANHFSFMAQHALLDDFGNLVAWVNHEKIGRIFGRHCIRRKFVDVYGKEAKVLLKEKVDMDDKTRAAYTEFEQLAILELEDETMLDAPNAAVNAIRCRQIMAHPHKFGILKDEELTGKEEALQLHVEDCINNGKPLLIFASLKPEQERIAALCTKWGLRTAIINSDVPTDKRPDIDQRFQKGELDCVVASPGTASVGFNWGHVDKIIFMSLDYQNVNFVQAYRRTIRGKRDHPVLIIVMEYRESIDHRLFQIVDKKSRDLAKVDDSYEVLNLSQI